jgi:hypothetical protein
MHTIHFTIPMPSLESLPFQQNPNQLVLLLQGVSLPGWLPLRRF